MPKVFLSHSWDDNEISRKIAQDLKRDGAEIWIDHARISGGESLPITRIAGCRLRIGIEFDRLKNCTTEMEQPRKFFWVSELKGLKNKILSAFISETNEFLKFISVGLHFCGRNSVYI